MPGTPTGSRSCLFDEGATADDPGRAVRLEERTHGMWFGFVPGHRRRASATPCGCDGPWRPAEGLRHNPDKLLLDPYARAIEGDVTWRPEVFGHRVDAQLRGDPDVRDGRDSAPYMPRCVVVDDDFDWGDDAPPQVPWTETVIYETHVRSLTRCHPDVPEELRGTYAGLAHPAALAHLTASGVTSVELLPVQAFASEPALVAARAWPTTGATTPSASSPRTRRTPPRPARRARWTSSRAWSRPCTARASR